MHIGTHNRAQRANMYARNYHRFMSRSYSAKLPKTEGKEAAGYARVISAFQQKPFAANLNHVQWFNERAREKVNRVKIPLPQPRLERGIDYRRKSRGEWFVSVALTLKPTLNYIFPSCRLPLVMPWMHYFRTLHYGWNSYHRRGSASRNRRFSYYINDFIIHLKRKKRKRWFI